MTIRRFVVPITVNAAGDATVYTPPVSGKVVSIAYLKTNFANGVTFVVTGETTATPIWSEVAVNASAVRAPRAAIHTTAGVAALYAGGGLAVNDAIALAAERIKVVVSAGGNATTGALHFTIDG